MMDVLIGTGIVLGALMSLTLLLWLPPAVLCWWGSVKASKYNLENWPTVIAKTRAECEVRELELSVARTRALMACDVVEEEFRELRARLRGTAADAPNP